jgi:folate-binding Fe-S cluster repair protein YgfZ
MLNLDLLSAVSFTKGCYIGQEIVARTQHLGRLKRRMLRYAGPGGASFSPGQPLYSVEARAGQVVAACDGPRGVELLAVTELRFCSDLLGARPGGSELVPADLPYAIPAPATTLEP